MTLENQTFVFHERQQFRQRWLWAVLLLAVVPTLVLLIYGLYYQIIRGRPFGNHPASDQLLIVVTVVTFITTAAAVGATWIARLDTYVTAGEIIVHFWPFHFGPRHFPLHDVARAYACEYSPITEYGGWGIRYGFTHGWAYNVSGNQGVQLELTNGKRILIGSQRSEELAKAIGKN